MTSLKSFTRVFQPFAGDAAGPPIRVMVEEVLPGKYTYAFPDGFVHACTAVDEKGLPECAFVNERVAQVG